MARREGERNLGGGGMVVLPWTVLSITRSSWPGPKEEEGRRENRTSRDPGGTRVAMNTLSFRVVAPPRLEWSRACTFSTQFETIGGRQVLFPTNQTTTLTLSLRHTGWFFPGPLPSKRTASTGNSLNNQSRSSAPSRRETQGS